MLKQLLKIPFLGLFQPEALEDRLNENVRRKRIFILIHILMVPVMFFINFVAFSIEPDFSFAPNASSIFKALVALIIAALSYIFAIIIAFFVGGLFKKDNLRSFITGNYWSLFFNILALNFYYNVSILDKYYRADYVTYNRIFQLVIFLSVAVLLILICALIINIYGRTKQFLILVFVICTASFIVNYIISLPRYSNTVNYLFLRDKTKNRKYIFVIDAPTRTNNLWTYLPTTTVFSENHLLVDIESGERIESLESVSGVPDDNDLTIYNAPSMYEIKKTYTLDKNTLKNIENDLINRNKSKAYKRTIKEYLKKLEKIEFAGRIDVFNGEQLREYLKNRSVELYSELSYEYYLFVIEEDYFIKFINKFSSETIITLSTGTYELDHQYANNFGYPTGYYSFKNLGISHFSYSGGNKREIRVEKINNSAETTLQYTYEVVPGEKIITVRPLKNGRVFLQTDAGYQFIDADTGQILEKLHQGWYQSANYNLSLESDYDFRLNENNNEAVYDGDVIYSLSPSGYLIKTQTSDGKILSTTSVYADDVYPFKNKSFYYVCFYYIFVGLLITYLGFYRIPIYILESVIHVICTSALSRGWISPKLSKAMTPVFFEHISTISFPFAKLYLRKLLSAAPYICTDSLIYLLTKTNQKRFAAEFSVDFFERNRDFLFEFIYKSLKFNDGEAMDIIVKNTRKGNSITDLLVSYQQLITQSSKKGYISTHISYLKSFVYENHKYANEILLSYNAFSLFYTLNDLQKLAESDKPLYEILQINYGELLNPQIIEMFNIIVEFAQDIKNYDIVENFRDKQYYLSEARIKLYDLSSQAREVLYEPEKSIFLEIFEKWQGVITSEAKSLRGPADIAVTILNKELSINGDNEWQSIVVKIKNTGLSPAENIQLSFLENEDTQILEKKKDVRLLGIGEEAKIEFSIKLRANVNNLRVNIDTNFDDFERKNKLRVFADILSVNSTSFVYKKVLNPYIVGTPLKNEKIFVGRSEALNFALDNLSGGTQNNALIYFGQRRIGKSSILYQLMNSTLSDDHVFVYIDCQGFADADTSRLLYRLCREIRSSALKRQILLDEPSLGKFKENTFLELDDYLDKVEQSLNGKKIVLMFDEYEFLEYMVKAEKVSPDIFNKLRNLMQHRNKKFAFIFVGTHRLTELTEDYWNFLFNIALYYEIGTLNEREARNLIVKPVEDYIKYDELAIDKIIRISGNHPYFIQVICRLIVNYCNEHLKAYINLKDINEILETAVEGGTAHVKYLFNDCSTKSEQEILTFLSRTTDETKLFASSAEIARYARENGFVYDIISVQEILSGLKNKKLVRQGGELGDLLGFEYEFLRLWIEKHVKIQKGFINIT